MLLLISLARLSSFGERTAHQPGASDKDKECSATLHGAAYSFHFCDSYGIIPNYSGSVMDNHDTENYPYRNCNCQDDT